METLTGKEHSLNSEKRECLKRKIILLKRIHIQVLKKQMTLYEEWRNLLNEEQETRR